MADPKFEGSDRTARRIVWDILQRVEEGAFADALLGHRLEKGPLDPRDAALVTRLVYATISWQAYLDHLLAPFSRRPIEEVDPPIRCLVRMALAQVCLFDKIPVFAAVDTAVELAKSHNPRAASFVNALLRRVATDWRTVPLPPEEEDVVRHLAVRWSHPDWLVEQWLSQFGREEAEALLAANNDVAPTAVRANPLRITPMQLMDELRQVGIEAEPSAVSPLGLRVQNPAGLDRLAAFRQGKFSIQAEASQLIAYMLAPRPGQRVLDLCAAPGGKSLHSVELMSNEGEVIARDISSRGVARIQREAKRLGHSILQAQIADAIGWRAGPAAQGEAPVGSFDRVLVDAPCTGLGTLRSHPELKWRRKPEDSRQLAVLQSRILDQAAAQVAASGLLVYSTCTLAAEENENIIDAFLRKHTEFELTDPTADLPEGMRGLIGDDLALRTAPHRGQLDGFYSVRLMRR